MEEGKLPYVNVTDSLIPYYWEWAQKRRLSSITLVIKNIKRKRGKGKNFFGDFGFKRKNRNDVFATVFQ